MPNTYTVNFNLPKPAKGDLDWDDEYHDAMDTIDAQLKNINDSIANHTSNINNPHNTSFIQLTDTPSSYSGLANRVVVVNGTATGLTTTTKVPLAEDSNKVGGLYPGNTANNVLKLDSTGNVPLSNLPTSLTGKSADMVDSLHFKTVGGLLYFSTDGTTWIVAGEMTKAVYDANNNGKVDRAENADYATNAGTATNATNATNADKVDGKHAADIVLKENTAGTYINVPSGQTISFKVNNTTSAYINNYGIVGSVYNADLAEGFKTNEDTMPANGTVMSFNPLSGLIEVCKKRNDKRFAGIISYTPGHLLGMTDNYKQEFKDNKKLPIALVGQVYARVKAGWLGIKAGDRLMTARNGKLTKCYWFGHQVATAMESIPPFEEKQIKVLLR